MAETQSADFSFAQVYAGTWRALTRRPLALLGIALLPCALPSIGKAYSAAYPLDAAIAAGDIGAIAIGLSALFFVLTAPFSQVAIMVLTLEDGDQAPENLGRALATGLRLMLPLLLQSLLWMVAIGAGASLLLFPAFMMATMWSVAPVVLVAEKSGPIAAFSRSARLTKGLRWKVFGAFLPAVLVYLLMAFGFEGFSLTGADDLAKTNLGLAMLVNIVANGLPMLWLTIFTVSLYQRLYAIKGEDTNSDLATVFA